MLKLMMEDMWCLRCRRRCEKAHGWRGNGGPMPVELEVSSLMQSSCMVMVIGDGSHEAELGWSELNVCLTTDGARV
jgi:hypothetical protein